MANAITSCHQKRWDEVIKMVEAVLKETWHTMMDEGLREEQERKEVLGTLYLSCLLNFGYKTKD